MEEDDDDSIERTIHEGMNEQANEGNVAGVDFEDFCKENEITTTIATSSSDSAAAVDEINKIDEIDDGNGVEFSPSQISSTTETFSPMNTEIPNNNSNFIDIPTPTMMTDQAIDEEEEEAGENEIGINAQENQIAAAATATTSDVGCSPILQPLPSSSSPPPAAALAAPWMQPEDTSSTGPEELAAQVDLAWAVVDATRRNGQTNRDLTRKRGGFDGKNNLNNNRGPQRSPLLSAIDQYVVTALRQAQYDPSHKEAPAEAVTMVIDYRVKEALNVLEIALSSELHEMDGPWSCAALALVAHWCRRRSHRKILDNSGAREMMERIAKRLLLHYGFKVEDVDSKHMAAAHNVIFCHVIHACLRHISICLASFMMASSVHQFNGFFEPAIRKELSLAADRNFIAIAAGVVSVTSQIALQTNEESRTFVLEALCNNLAALVSAISVSPKTLRLLCPKNEEPLSALLSSLFDMAAILLERDSNSPHRDEILRAVVLGIDLLGATISTPPEGKSKREVHKSVIERLCDVLLWVSTSFEPSDVDLETSQERLEKQFPLKFGFTNAKKEEGEGENQQQTSDDNNYNNNNNNNSYEGDDPLADCTLRSLGFDLIGTPLLGRWLPSTSVTGETKFVFHPHSPDFDPEQETLEDILVSGCRPSLSNRQSMDPLGLFLDGIARLILTTFSTVRTHSSADDSVAFIRHSVIVVLYRTFDSTFRPTSGNTKAREIIRQRNGWLQRRIVEWTTWMLKHSPALSSAVCEAAVFEAILSSAFHVPRSVHSLAAARLEETVLVLLAQLGICCASEISLLSEWLARILPHLTPISDCKQVIGLLPFVRIMCATVRRKGAALAPDAVGEVLVSFVVAIRLWHDECETHRDNAQLRIQAESSLAILLEHYDLLAHGLGGKLFPQLVSLISLRGISAFVARHLALALCRVADDRKWNIQVTHSYMEAIPLAIKRAEQLSHDHLDESHRWTIMIPVMHLLVGLQAVVWSGRTEPDKAVQKMLIKAGAFVQIVSVLNECEKGYGSPRLCVVVIRTLTALICGEEEARTQFASEVTYLRLLKLLCLLETESVTDVVCDSIVDMMLELPYIPGLHQVIRNPRAAKMLVKLVRIKGTMQVKLRVVEILRELSDSCPPNVSALSASGAMIDILRWFGDLRTPSSETIPLQKALVEVMTLIGRHSISVRELRHLFDLLRLQPEDSTRPRFSIRLLNALQRMTERSGPLCFFEFDGATTAMIVPCPANMKRASELSLAFWLRVESSESEVEHSISQVLFTLMAKGDNGVELLLEGDSLVCRVVGKTSQKSSDLAKTRVKLATIPSQTWIHIAVCFSFDRSLFSQKSDVGIILYINGEKDDSPVAFRPELPGKPVSCSIGGRVTPEGTVSKYPDRPLHGQLAALCLFTEKLSLRQVHELHRLGKTGHGLVCFDPDDAWLTSKMLLSYSANATRGSIILNNAPETAGQYDATGIGEFHSSMSRSMLASLSCLGGAATLLPLLRQLQLPLAPSCCVDESDMAADEVNDEDTAAMIVRLILATIKESAPAAAEAVKYHVLDIVGQMIKDAPTFATEGLLRILEETLQPGFFSNEHPEELRDRLQASLATSLLLDMDVWSKASWQTQQAVPTLFQVFSASNSHVFRLIGVDKVVDSVLNSFSLLLPPVAEDAKNSLSEEDRNLMRDKVKELRRSMLFVAHAGLVSSKPTPEDIELMMRLVLFIRALDANIATDAMELILKWFSDPGIGLNMLDRALKFSLTVATSPPSSVQVLGLEALVLVLRQDATFPAGISTLLINSIMKHHDFGDRGVIAVVKMLVPTISDLPSSIRHLPVPRGLKNCPMFGCVLTVLLYASEAVQIESMEYLLQLFELSPSLGVHFSSSNQAWSLPLLRFLTEAHRRGSSRCVSLSQRLLGVVHSYALKMAERGWRVVEDTCFTLGHVSCKEVVREQVIRTILHDCVEYLLNEDVLAHGCSDQVCENALHLLYVIEDFVFHDRKLWEDATALFRATESRSSMAGGVAAAASSESADFVVREVGKMPLHMMDGIWMDGQLVQSVLNLVESQPWGLIRASCADMAKTTDDTFRSGGAVRFALRCVRAGLMCMPQPDAHASYIKQMEDLLCSETLEMGGDLGRDQFLTGIHTIYDSFVSWQLSCNVDLQNVALSALRAVITSKPMLFCDVIVKALGEGSEQTNKVIAALEDSEMQLLPEDALFQFKSLVSSMEFQNVVLRQLSPAKEATHELERRMCRSAYQYIVSREDGMVRHTEYLVQRDSHEEVMLLESLEFFVAETELVAWQLWLQDIGTERKEQQCLVTACWQQLWTSLSNERGPWARQEPDGPVIWALNGWEGPDRKRLRLRRRRLACQHLAAAKKRGRTQSPGSSLSSSPVPSPGFPHPVNYDNVESILADGTALNLMKVLTVASLDDHQSRASTATTSLGSPSLSLPLEDDNVVVPALVALPCKIMRLSETVRGVVSIMTWNETPSVLWIADPVLEDEGGKTVVRGKCVCLLGKDECCDRSCKRKRWAISSVLEMHDGLHVMQNVALEVVFASGRSQRLVFESAAARSRFARTLRSLHPNRSDLYWTPKHLRTRLAASSNRWMRREMSNFAYLMELNTLSGRSYHDLSQYPVVPWILNDYTSETIDLNDPNIYRDLTKPMGCQTEERKQYFISRYEDSCGDEFSIRSHYTTHYSCPAYVCDFLVRLEPYTSLHIELQSGQFDHADRMFKNFAESWRTATTSTQDVRELIPEMFFQPAALVNMSKFDLGVLQSGKVLNDVELPPWASTAEEFVRIHMLAMESEYVSQHLHDWINLIWGYQQRGVEAVEAVNLFMPHCYQGGVNLDSIDDPLQLAAIVQQIKNFGQTPTQLFNKRHVSRQPRIAPKLNPWREANCCRDAELQESDDLLSAFADSEKILLVSNRQVIFHHKWFPLPSPVEPFMIENTPSFSRAIGAPQRVPQKPMAGAGLFAFSQDGNWIFSGGHWDNSIKGTCISNSKATVSLLGHKDVVACVSLSEDGQFLASGSDDTTVMVWNLPKFGGSPTQATAQVRHVLYGHDDAVTCVTISSTYDIVVSGSKDGSFIAHQLFKGKFLFSVKHPRSKVDVPAVVEYVAVTAAGEILVYSSRDGHLHVFSINGLPLRSVDLPEHPALLVYWNSPPHSFLFSAGVRKQVFARSIDDLSLARQIGTTESPIVALCVAPNAHQIFALVKNSQIAVFRFDPLESLANPTSPTANSALQQQQQRSQNVLAMNYSVSSYGDRYSVINNSYNLLSSGNGSSGSLSSGSSSSSSASSLFNRLRQPKIKEDEVSVSRF